ncbi:MAG: type II toxin-antitoxin system Phd/YefM family antitoxin [Chloracidobacterium sp.]|nr:type II toxin-antitoxin system Phd/YefM family antitoxin [Chloracidobacterium sp.]
MKQVSVFEGKNKFSELVANAAKGEPQVITKNGTATAVVISFTEYKPDGKEADVKRIVAR